ncbi:MAG: hypothetical protein WAM66_08595 [Acidobacteriaceae bacterium]
MAYSVAAWSTLALAILSLIAVGISYWGIKKQTASFASSVAADLCLKLTDRFDNDQMLETRSRAAKALLDKSNLQQADDVFDFFELIGLYVRKKVLDAEIAHSIFFHWTNLYWNAGKNYIIESRKQSSVIYSDFELLYDTVLRIEKRVDPKSHDIDPTEADIEAFLRQELGEGSEIDRGGVTV